MLHTTQRPSRAAVGRASPSARATTASPRAPSRPPPPPEPDERSSADDLVVQPSFLAPIFDLLRVTAVLVGLLGLAFAVAQGLFLFNQIALLPSGRGCRPMPCSRSWRWSRRISPASSPGRTPGQDQSAPSPPALRRPEAPRGRPRRRRRAQVRRGPRDPDPLPAGVPARAVRRAAAAPGLGLRAGEVETLYSLQHVLTDPGAAVDDGEWLRRFDREFLGRWTPSPINWRRGRLGRCSC